MEQPTQRPHGKTLLAFALFVLLVVAVINITGWALWHFTSELLTKLLDRHLSSIAVLVSSQIDGDALLQLRPGEEETATYERLRLTLAKHRTRFELADLYVLDAENRTLASADEATLIGFVNPALELDRSEILDAWMGESGITPIISRGSHMLRTSYAPIRTRGGGIAAVLGVETDVRFFDTLALLRNGLFGATMIALILVGGLALLFRRLLNRLLLVEEQSQETERLALVGRLSAQICHEIRNPLSVISASAEYVVRRIGKLGVNDKTLGELVDYIMSEIDRLNDILTRFLQVARRPELQMEPASVRSLLDPLIALASPDLEKANIELETRVTAGEEVISMDVNSMRQVLLNAILNARDALEGGKERKICLEVNRVGEDRVEIRVLDSGEGVPEHIKGDIFEPFVTTKASGTGLGLFIAKRIIDEHRGTVRLDPLSEGGTQFVVELPVYRKRQK